MNDGPATATALLDDLPFDEHDEEWVVARSTREIRLRLPVVALVALMLVAAGFWGGAVVQKSHGSSGSTAGAGGLQPAWRPAARVPARRAPQGSAAAQPARQP